MDVASVRVPLSLIVKKRPFCNRFGGCSKFNRHLSIGASFMLSSPIRPPHHVMILRSSNNSRPSYEEQEQEHRLPNLFNQFQRSLTSKKLFMLIRMMQT
ncbi:hypothetical protein BV898_11885 [Hypsibius exemplaris]|uniref:Uncharacterized protein n=1 Tax=Hypsibius exemplaris TaxID=2072580 RepID=A0A1W0WFB3_HYPEX|nr:hypothetical protein BV898_11885 [Hypsibius exemplaris]